MIINLLVIDNISDCSISEYYEIDLFLLKIITSINKLKPISIISKKTFFINYSHGLTKNIKIKVNKKHSLSHNQIEPSLSIRKSKA